MTWRIVSTVWLFFISRTGKERFRPIGSWNTPRKPAKAMSAGRRMPMKMMCFVPEFN